MTDLPEGYDLEMWNKRNDLEAAIYRYKKPGTVLHKSIDYAHAIAWQHSDEGRDAEQYQKILKRLRVNPPYMGGTRGPRRV